jgi:hypothetical protein
MILKWQGEEKHLNAAAPNPGADKTDRHQDRKYVAKYDADDFVHTQVQKRRMAKVAHHPESRLSNIRLFVQ